MVAVRWFRWDAVNDEEDEADDAEEEEDAALRAAMAVGERRPMPDERSSLEIGRAYALGAESLYACL